MPISNFSGGFADGVAIRNRPIAEPTFGQTFYVDSGAQAKGGGTFKRPFGTIGEALAKCIANNGDFIYVAPGHTETVSTAGGVTLNKAGVSIVGLGTGFNRPLFDFSATAATFLVTANNCSIENVRFRNQVDGLVTAVSISAANFSMIRCETIDDDSNFACTNFITVATGANFCRIIGWTHTGFSGKTGAASALTIAGVRFCQVQPISVVGNFSTAAIVNSAAATELRVWGDASIPAYVRNLNSADVIVTCNASTTGHIGPNIYARLADNAANITEAFVMAAGVFFDPIMIANNAGERGMQFNATASTDA